VESRVGIRKLRDELTRQLGYVRRGARITVTDRGRPVALLLPYAEDRPSEKLRNLLSSGHIALAERQFLAQPPLIRGKGALPSDLISEGRR
jgi:prevent-host-death family protein